MTNRVAGIVTPYKVEVVQGNFVSKEQVQALQRGMLRSQVKEVLGTPLMSSVFHADRWDYVFTLRRQGVAPQARKLTLFFQGDQLDKWEGDEMPSEAEFVAQLDAGRKSAKVPLLEVPEDVLKEFNLKNPPAQRAPTAVVAAAPAAAYPPLEAPGTSTQAWDASTQRAVVAQQADALIRLRRVTHCISGEIDLRDAGFPDILQHRDEGGQVGMYIGQNRDLWHPRQLMRARWERSLSFSQNRF